MRAPPPGLKHSELKARHVQVRWFAAPVCACFGLLLVSPAGAAPFKDSGTLATMAKYAARLKDRDADLCGKVTFSADFNHWCDAAAKGDWKVADPLWAKVLDGVAPCNSIQPLLNRAFTRMIFVDPTENAPTPTEVFQHMLDVTSSHMGKNHRFAAELLSNVAYQYESRHEYQAAKANRLRELTVSEACYGKDALKTAFALHNAGYTLFRLKQYQQAEPLLKRALAIEEKHKYMQGMQQLVPLCATVLQKMGRTGEAAALRQKYAGAPRAVPDRPRLPKAD
jgi:tetratricopeptide (TPR) repeat protein